MLVFILMISYCICAEMHQSNGSLPNEDRNTLKIAFKTKKDSFWSKVLSSRKKTPEEIEEKRRKKELKKLQKRWRKIRGGKLHTEVTELEKLRFFIEHSGKTEDVETEYLKNKMAEKFRALHEFSHKPIDLGLQSYLDEKIYSLGEGESKTYRELFATAEKIPAVLLNYEGVFQLFFSGVEKLALSREQLQKVLD